VCAIGIFLLSVLIPANAADRAREIAAHSLLAEGEKLNEATQPAAALGIFERVAREYPETEAGMFAQFRRAETLVFLDRCTEAIARAQMVIETYPNTVVAAWAQWCIGRALISEGRVSDGVEALRKVAEILPDRSDLTPFDYARLELGSLCETHIQRSGNILDAAKCLRVDASDSKSRAEILATVAAYRGKDGRIDLAYPLLRRLAEECPSESMEIEWARTQVATAYLRSRNCKREELSARAVELLEPIASTGRAGDDVVAKATLWLARYYKVNGEPKRAAELLQPAIERCLNTSHGAEMLYELGLVLARVGKSAESLSAMKRLVDEKPFSKYADAARNFIEVGLPSDPSEPIESLVKWAEEHYAPKYRLLAFAPGDGSLDNPYLVAMQAVALAKEDRPDLSIELLDRFAAQRENAGFLIERAISDARLLAAENPKTVVASWAQFAVGRLMIERGEVAGGVAELRKVRAFRNDTRAFDAARMLLGKLCVERLGNDRDVLDAADFLGISKSQPASRAELYAIVAGYLGREGRIDLANPILARMESECPGDGTELAWAKTQVGVGYLRLHDCGGEFAKLAADMLAGVCSSGFDGDDTAAEACLWLARYRNRQGNLEDAVALLSSAESRYSKTAHAAEILYELGFALRRQNRAEEGIAVLRRVVKGWPLTKWARLACDAVGMGSSVGSSSLGLQLPAQTVTAGRAADSVIGALRPAFTAQEEGSVANLTPLDRLLSPWKDSHLDLLRAKGEIALCAVCSAIENKRYSMEAAGVAASIIVELSRLLDRKYTESSVVLLNTIAKIVTDTKENPLSASVSAEWFNSLAHMYSSVKLYRKALKMLQRASAFSDVPIDLQAKIRYYMGLFYREIRHPDSAEHCFQTVIRRYPQTGWSKLASMQLVDLKSTRATK